MTDREVDRAKLQKYINKAGDGYDLARTVTADADDCMEMVQRLMDYAGLDRVETDKYLAVRPKKGTKIRLEKQP